MSKSRSSSGATGRQSRSALPLILLLAAVAAGAGYWYGTRQSPPPEPPRDSVEITRPAKGDNDVVNKVEKVPVDPGKDPVRQAVEAQLATSGTSPSAFPKGSKLVGMSVKDGTATLELSPEFIGVNNAGDTGESLAYNALRKVLAQFPSIKYMRVMVDGKVFEGEHSGAWAEVPVRDEEGGTEEKS